ncbi:RluA family pseudouridine synthase [Paenibacillus albus]|uniref:Pseudouridine synthase n=1 Tax=Paenibacillus albus TaxID=2495582 RepID=A0A3S9AB62_9BACL|nr:RluA family pseudouridine synthase [Paenibacillus albus]AZN42978.1 RluA family pseudouridine synthase [Paenibacillus albus]
MDKKHSARPPKQQQSSRAGSTSRREPAAQEQQRQDRGRTQGQTQRTAAEAPRQYGKSAAAAPNNRRPAAAQPQSSARPARRPAPSPRPASPAPSKNYVAQEQMELLAFLLQEVKGEGRNAIKAMLSRGQIAVNGTPQKMYNYMLQPGQTVTVSKERIIETPPLIGLTILYEDADVIVVIKEAGLLSIATDQEPELTAYRQLTAHVRASNPSGRIFVVHRLDRDTSGVMMFAKSEHVQQQLQTTWQDTVKERTYIALVEGKVRKQEDTISSYLKESKTLKMYSTSNQPDAQHAVTHYKVLQQNSHFSLLEVSLETGRKNQIRVHMEDIGHPIVGDKKYSSRSKALNRLGLHARLLAFIHPTTGKLVRFESDIPRAFFLPFKEGFTRK